MMAIAERAYYRAIDANALFRIIDDPENEVLTGYFANVATRGWVPGPRILTDIAMGDSLVERIPRRHALRRLRDMNCEADSYDGDDC